MKTLLTLKTYDKDEQLIKTSKQWSRSFTKRFIEMLYTQANRNSLSTSGYASVGLHGATQTIDTYYPDNRKSGTTFLSCAGGSGETQMVSTSMLQYNGSSYDPTCKTSKGDLVGIVVGGGDTAATPTDYRLEKRFCHGSRAAEGSDRIVDGFEYANNNTFSVYSGQSYGAMINFRESFWLYSVWYYMYRTNDPDVITMTMYPVITQNSVGSALASKAVDCSAISLTGEWIAFDLASPVWVEAGVNYAFQLSGTLTSSYKVNLFYTSNSGHTNMGYIANSDPSDSNGYSIYSRFYGRSAGQLLYGGNDFTKPVFAAGTGTFTMSRNFTNATGGDMTIKEIGIYAMAGRTYGIYTYQSQREHNPLCICRDVLGSPVTLTNGQILKVTYTPTITV